MLTLLIPTADYRLKYFYELLDWLVQNSCKYKLLVADFGVDPIEEKLSKYCNSLDIEYLYNGKIPYFEHILRAADRIQTKYCLFHPDDDFMFMDVIDKSIKILEDRPDIEVSQGKAMRYVEGVNPLGFSPYQMLSIMDASPLDRLANLSSSYNHQMYLVQRTKSFIDKMTAGQKFSNDVMFWQYYDSAYSVIKGKSNVFDNLGFIRRIHNDGWGMGHVKTKDKTVFPYLITQPDFSEKFSTFQAEVRILLSQQAIDVKDPSVVARLDEIFLNFIYWGMLQKRKKNIDKELLPVLLKQDFEKAKFNKLTQHIRSYYD